ncbi:hypothetical protein B296_00022186 [Ensete ventricosum]|uniref:Uncharacterized protein n=1 Tax=Ensete ventricosum TaxID=4639 RepID=A0A426YJM9_ENSVE|nr:hypothetical protein B296_00022186 [Ensete ventricosum]
MSKPNQSTKIKNLNPQEQNGTYGFHRRGSREAIVAAPETIPPSVDLGRISWSREISCRSSCLLRTAREGKGGGWKKEEEEAQQDWDASLKAQSSRPHRRCSYLFFFLFHP